MLLHDKAQPHVARAVKATLLHKATRVRNSSAPSCFRCFRCFRCFKILKPRENMSMSRSLPNQYR
uniref:Histone-lysine N-methyltransferase SETMAR n=1 Tax=Glossina morsitans morsitans TaxID=37546 RepID=A0ABK9NGC9_GLOMM